MSDFFDRLGTELHDAAGRRPRRAAAWRPALGGGGAALLVAALVALALVPLVVVLGSGEGSEDRERRDPGRTYPPPPEPPRPKAPVGTVIPKGTGYPPRETDSTVVATGRARVTGPWQMETYRSKALRDPKTREVYQPAGLPCLTLFVFDPPPGVPIGGGACGRFARTPGFSRLQTTSTRRGGPRKEMLVFGRVPKRAQRVQVAQGDLHVSVRPFEGPAGVRGDFYLLATSPEPGRVNWFDAAGRPGSRGIELLPP